MIAPTRTAACVLMMVAAIPSFGATPKSAPARGAAWQEVSLEGRKLLTTGRNEFFILEPGFRTVLEGEGVKVVTTVLDETQVVNGITTRVVEEQEWTDGQLVESTRNYYAICEKTNDVLYFGEEVDVYKAGKVVSHGGSWLAGRAQAKPGMVLPGTPKIGQRFYCEIVPKVAVDRAEITSLDDTVETPAGKFSKCLTLAENAVLSKEKVVKTYAPGIGLVHVEEVSLTEYGFITKK